MSHGDKVTAIPADFVTVASTESCPFAIMANEENASTAYSSTRK
jgi:GMP synthase (glutamine-hydrolysing)